MKRASPINWLRASVEGKSGQLSKVSMALLARNTPGITVFPELAGHVGLIVAEQVHGLHQLVVRAAPA